MTAPKSKTTNTADVASSLAAFAAAIKDDPSLTDTLRNAADDLHAALGGKTDDTPADEG